MISDGSIRRSSRQSYIVVLVVLLLLFCIRVIAQFIQAFFPMTVLPPFEAWASGALPYWLLVVCQMLIIIVCAGVIWRLRVGLVVPSVTTGKVLLSLGSIYFGLMGLRLIIGLTVATDHYWFSARLPTFFHFVLAGFVLVYGWFHFRASGASYPHRLGPTS